ncbi:lipopolysaccharide biosynthesis protein [uncultured Phycicoccus sp.]|uniref:lipopolysaccharide biosynthesis protein n=1 Tax=uncultured Phycicoccus sp. TaxID=661422 RepID=UPI00261515BC|nr:lipopolysaccharide biosynthesis protein [uncultured Phycicoccus sp.]
MTAASPPSYGARAGRGVVATIGNQLYRILLQVTSVVVLARLLDPRDFGLVAMVVAIISLGEVLRDLGLSGAAIQAPELTPGQRDNLFWLNTGMGALVALVVCAAAPLIAAVYGRPELVAITLALAPTFVVSGLTTQYRVGLVRALRFQRLAWIEAVSVTLALGLGVALALAGAEYWALVGQQLASGVFMLGLVVGADPWRAGRWRGGEGTLRFVRFGGHLLASSVANYLSSNADTVVVGRSFGADVLGVYNRGAQLIRQPGRQVMGAFGVVLQPVLAKIHTDRTRLEAALRDSQRAVAYPLAVVAAVVAAAPADIVRLALGERWVVAAPYLTAMSAGVVLRAVTQNVSLALVACGLGRHLSRYAVFSAASTVTVVVVASLGGPVAVAWTAALAPLLTFTLGYAWLHRWAQVEVRRLRLDGARVVALGVAAALAGRLVAAQVPDLHDLARLLLVGGAVLAVFAVAVTLRPVRRDVEALVGHIRRALDRGAAS